MTGLLMNVPFGVVDPCVPVEVLVITGLPEMVDALLDAEIIGDGFLKNLLDLGLTPFGNMALLRFSVNIGGLVPLFEVDLVEIGVVLPL